MLKNSFHSLREETGVLLDFRITEFEESPQNGKLEVNRVCRKCVTSTEPTCTQHELYQNNVQQLLNQALPHQLPYELRSMSQLEILTSSLKSELTVLKGSDLWKKAIHQI